MKLLLVLFILAAALAGADPLTMDEARDYMAAEPESAAQDIVALDAIERAVPEVAIPDAVGAWTDGGLALTWGGPLTVDIAGRLAYEFTLPPAYFPDIREPRPIWPYFAAAGAGLLLGSFIGHAIP